MMIHIDGREIDPEHVIYNDRSFGVPSGRPEVNYNMIFSKNDFMNSFEEEYNNYVNECKEDDEKYGDVDIKELNDAGYPLLAESFSENTELLIYLIKEYIYINLFDCLFDKKDRNSWNYAINSISDIDIDDNRIVIKGSAYAI